VVVPGCIDFAVFEPSRVPAELADRPSYDHNPEFRLVRTCAQDMRTVAGIFAERLAGAKGPVRVAVPTRGLSIPNTPDGPFWDPDGRRRASAPCCASGCATTSRSPSTTST
jgi:uncharacterized protein (UPF0261 family)